MNSELLYITRKLGYPSSFGTRAGLGDFLEQYPDGVYAENGGGAPMGWESAALWFGGDSERAAARFERMMSERNELSRVFRTRIAGVLVLTFIYRLKSRMVTAIPIVGGQPQPVIDTTWLYFTMPEGGTVTLTKNGTPAAITLEYSLDNGSTWTEWVESGNVRSLTLAAGQTMHVRNTSETSTAFSTGTNDFYQFGVIGIAEAHGNCNSLLCKNPSDALLTPYCFRALFRDCQILTSPELPSTVLADNCYNSMFTRSGISIAPNLPATTLYERCYYALFRQCTLTETPILPATTLVDECYSYMFYFANISSITLYANDISSFNCLFAWTTNVPSIGDFYCPAELTIPTGANGIPTGWTRHDI